MAVLTDEQLGVLSQQVADETAPGANTAERVGELFQDFVDSKVNVVRLPKLYAALLNQTDTGAPVATILHNDLSDAIVWSRSAQGSYLGTLTGVFTTGKTAVIITTGDTAGVQINYTALTDGIVEIDQNTFAGSPQDGLSNAYIEIKIYP